MYYTGRLSTLAGMQTIWKGRRQMISSLFASLLVLEKGKGFGKKGLCAVLIPAGVKLSHLSCRQLLKRVGKDVIFIVKCRFFYSSQHPSLTFFPLSVTPSFSLSSHWSAHKCVVWSGSHVWGDIEFGRAAPDSRLLDDNSAVVQGVFSLFRCLSAWQLLSAGAEPCKNLLQRSFFSSCSPSQRRSQQTHSHTQSIFHKVREQF